METNRRLALMIDGDNAQAELLPQMLVEASKYGTLAIRRIYGDWSEPNMKGWKDLLLSYALQPVQQFRYGKGKNGTDIALIIDAMDLLHTGSIDGFCIASSDSDFTRLATRIREKNLFVLGIGRQNTLRAFVNACDVFIYTEILEAVAVEANTEIPVPIAAIEDGNEMVVDAATDPLRLEKLFRTAFDLAVQDDGWANLAAVGSFLRQLDSGFDPRTYGYNKLSQLVEASSDFIKTRKETNENGGTVIYIRLQEDS